MIWVIILIAVLLIAVWAVKTLNDFKRKEIRVSESLSGIEVVDIRP